jgi:hypothetical protein
MGFLSEIEEKKIPDVKNSANPASTIPISHPQPCPLCQCPALWVSVYDSSHAHCRVCEPAPALSVVQGHCNVILSLSESRYANRAYEWENNRNDQTAVQPTTGVVDDAEWETMTTAVGEVIHTVKGWRDVSSRNYSQWMVIAVKQNIKNADDLLKFDEIRTN